MIRELTDDIRRVRADLEELWQLLQDSPLGVNSKSEIARELEEAADALSHALRLISSGGQ